jgi:acyl-CoA synthetase (AMP-forming)/AMP-acid ligase II
VAILDDEGHPQPTGDVGEVCVRGDVVMAGCKDPEATAAVSALGWHHTGDLGYLDAEGYLHRVDRKKDMIVTGGFNVHSVAVSRPLHAHRAFLTGRHLAPPLFYVLLFKPLWPVPNSPSTSRDFTGNCAPMPSRGSATVSLPPLPRRLEWTLLAGLRA